MERYLIQSKNVVNISRRLRKRKRLKEFKKKGQKRKELMGLTETYENKFGITIGEYLPFGEFLKSPIWYLKAAFHWENRTKYCLNNKC